MILSLKVLNSDATLNSFVDIGSFKIVKGSDAKILLELYQSDKKLRYIPASGSIITMDFLRSGTSALTKTASFPFADDRSIIEFDLTDTETANIISQNLLVKIVEGSTTTYAILQSGLQMVSTTQLC